MSDSPRDNLPKDLAKQFAKLERKLWVKETTIAVLGALLVFVVAWAIAFASDRFWDTPVRLRSALLLCSGVGMMAYLVVWLRNWRWDRRDERSFARIIQMTQRRLGDKLLGAVELANGELKQGRMSPALRQAAIEQVSHSAKNFDFTSVIDHGSVRKLVGVALVVMGAAIATTIVAPRASWNALARLSAPFLDAPRFTFVTLSELPEELIVQHGDDFTVRGKVEYHGFWKPDIGRVQFAEQAEQEIPLADKTIVARVEGQTIEGGLRIRVGDAEATVKISPTHPPVLGKLHADVLYPQYLQYPDTNFTFSGPTLTVVEGSSVGLHTQASRNLAGVRLEMEGKDPVDLPIDGANFETPTYQPAGEMKGSIHIEDQLGLTNASPRHFALRSRPDEPPLVQLLDLPPEISILESDVLPLNLFVQDDYGIKLAGIGWRIENVAASNQPPVTEYKSSLSNATQIEYTNTHIFSPTVLGIPPESVVEVRAAATDFYPDRSPASSLRHRIHVVGNIRHAKSVRDQLEALFSQLEEITRDEEGIAQKTAEIKNQDPKKADADQDNRDLDETATKQEKTNRQLREIARSGRRILEEAMRNPAINQKTLKEWTENISDMDNLAKSEMKESAEELREAREQSGQGQQQKQQRQNQLAKAQDAQQRALKKLQEMQKKMNDGLDNLEALTLSQRLKRLADEEEGIVSQIRSVITETIGLKPYELQDRHRFMNTRLAEEQKKAGEDSGKIRDEIGRFFDRTQKKNYGRVHTEMKETKVDESLTETAEMIGGNIAMETMQDLNLWSLRLQKWAKFIAPPESDGSSSAGGNKQQQQQQEMIKLFIALLRARLTEVNLLHRTRLLDDNQEDQKRYEAAAEKLSDDQRDVRVLIAKLHMRGVRDEFKDLMLETANSMGDAEYSLLDLETGDPAQKSELAAIQHLSDLINLINERAKRGGKNQQQQQSQQQQQTAQQMQMLMQIARQQMRTAFARIPGMKPGGNPAGGGKGQTGQLGGDPVGAGDGERGVEGSSANGNFQVPTEFKGVLEQYFKAVEEQQKNQ
ncbi:MAG: hypothetical protein ACPGVU_11495 [Limisphaerales bacterium]